MTTHSEKKTKTKHPKKHETQNAPATPYFSIQSYSYSSSTNGKTQKEQELRYKESSQSKPQVLYIERENQKEVQRITSLKELEKKMVEKIEKVEKAGKKEQKKAPAVKKLKK